MGLILTGVGVSKGIAIGNACVLSRDQFEIDEYVLPKQLVAEEVARFRQALVTAKKQLKEIHRKIPRNTPVDIASFLEAHVLMLDDSALSDVPVRLIKSQQCNAAWALKQQRDALVGVFEAMDDPYLRTRKDDIDHVVHRIMRILLNHAPQPFEAPDNRLTGSIVVLEDLSPADSLLMHQQGIAAFVTESGGVTSHTTILARSLGIPAVAGVRHARRDIPHNAVVVIDGQQGLVLVDPDEHALRYFRARQREEKRHTTQLAKLKDQPAVTRDGVTITLQANVELPDDLHALKRMGATGVGLYRTEFLFMNCAQLPSEEEQLHAYLHIVRGMKGAPVTIRTLDLGADKMLNGHRIDMQGATNPALGLRAVRLCLKEPSLFRPQLRAILRASAHGAVRMMIPMLAAPHELAQVMQLVAQVKQELKEEGHKYDEKMPIGGMIEVPAAALMADVFARQLDFMSIGTNDLIQYTLATDRIDEAVNYLYNPLHPGVLRLIDMTISAGRKANTPVAMCGEMAGDTRYTRLLLGMGLDQFSMHPAMLLEIKSIVQSSNLAELRKMARKVLKCSDPDEINALVDKMNA